MAMTLHFALLVALAWLTASLWLGEKWLPHFKRPDSAEALNRWLQNWQLLAQSGGGLNQLGEIPRFKFFSHLAECGLRHARTFGSFPRELLWEWRDGLSKERSFDKRWRNIIYSAYAQFLLFMIITWAFVIMARSGLTLQISLLIYVVMALLQFAGLMLFAPALSVCSKRELKGFSELLESLYVLRSLSGAGLATAQVLQEAKLERLVATPALKPLVSRVEQLAVLYQKQGGQLGREAQILLQETWFLREEKLTKLYKTGEGLKLAFLLVFFAGSYFCFLAGMVLTLMV